MTAEMLSLDCTCSKHLHNFGDQTELPLQNSAQLCLFLFLQVGHSSVALCLFHDASDSHHASSVSVFDDCQCYTALPEDRVRAERYTVSHFLYSFGEEFPSLPPTLETESLLPHRHTAVGRQCFHNSPPPPHFCWSCNRQTVAAVWATSDTVCLDVPHRAGHVLTVVWPDWGPPLHPLSGKAQRRPDHWLLSRQDSGHPRADCEDQLEL